MSRRAKPAKAKSKAKRPVAGKPQKSDGSRLRDLEKRLAAALKDKAEALEQLQTSTRELAEAHEQQTATSEILRVIMGSPSDAGPTFEAIAASAARLCAAGEGTIFRFDGTLIHLAAHCGLVQNDLLRRVFPRPVGRGSVTARAILTRSVVHVPDTTADPELEHTPLRTAGFRTVLSVPMLRDGDPIGAITVSRQTVAPFSDGQIALLRTFADQAVIAVENVRLLNETNEALKQQTATSKILRVISASPTDVQPVFEAIAQSGTRLCDAAFAAVFRFDGQLQTLAAHHNVTPAELEILHGQYPKPATRGAATGRAIVDRRTVHIPDIREDREYTSPTRAAMGFRAVLAVPMLRHGEPIGALGLWRREARPFTKNEITLVQAFADQAVIAIENVRLFTELEGRNRDLTEALERQTATAEILRIISRSQTDVQPVFNTIAESALALLGAWSVLIAVYDGKLLRLGALGGGLPDSERYQRERFPMPLASGLAISQCILARAPRQEPDCLAHPDPGVRERARHRGHRAMLAVPMLRGGEAIGAILVSRREAGVFAEAEVALLQTFADQAVIAIENARLLSELQARTKELTRSVEQLTALGDVGRALSATLDLDTVLQTIVTRASQLAGTDACAVFEYDEVTEAFRLRAGHNLDEEVVALARRTPVRKGEGVQGRMAMTRQPIQVSDIAVEHAYRGPLREILLRTGTRAVLAVPMLREDQLIGGFTVNRKTPGEFSPELIELLQTFATQSALAIQNARLFREIADKSRQLEAASQHKSEFLANMSHELRTPLNAIIGFSEVLTERMFGEVNEKQEEYVKDIHASGQHLLSLINDILDLSKIEAGRMELELTDFHLPAAIDNALTLVRERAGRRGIALHQAVDEQLGQIRGDERKLKQVVLNLLSNALKFTPEGGRIDVRAGLVDGLVEISVADTGVGIAPEDQEAIFEEFRQVGTAARQVEGTGLGLALSRKFIELQGGRIWVESQVGAGSRFTFTIPVSPAA